MGPIRKQGEDNSATSGERQSKSRREKIYIGAQAVDNFFEIVSIKSASDQLNCKSLSALQ